GASCGGEVGGDVQERAARVPGAEQVVGECSEIAVIADEDREPACDAKARRDQGGERDVAPSQGGRGEDESVAHPYQPAEGDPDTGQVSLPGLQFAQDRCRQAGDVLDCLGWPESPSLPANLRDRAEP